MLLSVIGPLAFVISLVVGTLAYLVYGGNL